jgi:hypothetical protein
VKRLLYTFILVTGLLAACTQVDKQPEIQTLAITHIDQIKWLTIIPATRSKWSYFNCAANEFNIPGQGFKHGGVGGADGGMTYDVSLTTDTGVTTANARGKGWNFMPGMLAPPVQPDVTLLIVDDFRGDALGNNAVYKPLPDLFLQEDLNIATLKSLQANNKLSHGSIVNDHAINVIKGTGLYPYRSNPSPDVTDFRTTLVPGRGTRYLTVKAVNPGFDSTGDIAGSITSETIAEKLSPLLPPTSGIPPIVVNMSFALLPCEAYADYIAYDNETPGDLTFQDYVEKLAVKNKDTFDNLALVIVKATDDPSDPLYQLIQNTAKYHIFVASSGNYGFNKTAMNPAKRPGVVSVTGSAANNTLARHSRFNKGEIMDVGASFLLRASRFTRDADAKDVFYLGTSFAAPIGAAYLALDTGSQQRCIVPNPVPFPFIRSKLAINSANLVNTPLQKAVTILCP